MGQKRSRAASRAWRILRIALLWARKGGILKCRLMSELKALYRHSSSLDSYGERELSFDETPILRLGMSRPSSLRFKLPCIKPSVVDFDDEIYARGRRPSGLLESEMEEDSGDKEGEESEEDEEERIDERADEFIARFYEQMKMQRQVSYIEYQEMLRRGTAT
ncbi:hypothetical protein V2J09_022149 [Rumex salicifolius]